MNRGCIPSKMLVYPADLMREAAEAGRIGVQLGTPAVDWGIVSERMWQQIRTFNQGIRDSFASLPGLDIYHATASFQDSHTLRLDYADRAAQDLIAGERIVIATGARPWIPPIEGLETTGYLTTDSFFGAQYPAAPWKRLVIVGGGAIGAEFAHIFATFGTEVTLVEMKPHLIPAEETEISAFVERQFAHHGIRVLTGYKTIAAKADGDAKVLVVEELSTGKQHAIATDAIFIASGVRSNSDLLHCENAGVALDARGWITTNARLETSQPHIYAIGDINGQYQFRHKANYEATILSHNLYAGGDMRSACYHSVPWAIFTWPQVAHVGLTEVQAKQLGLRVWVGKNYYSEVVAGIAMGYTQAGEDNGFVKVIAGEDKRILGVHIVGPQAAVLVQPFVYLMNAGYACETPYCMNPQDTHTLHLPQEGEACWRTGSLRPIMDSMVIHPSLNELTAWALDHIDWDHEA